MENIIIKLDNEGINLQETILNLEHQGYIEYWYNWVEHIYQTAIINYTMSLSIKQLKKEGLI